MTRRDWLSCSAGAAVLSGTSDVMAQSQPQSKLGVAATSYLSYRKPKDSLEFLNYCANLGAAGIQIALSDPSDDYVSRFRKRLTETNLYYEAMIAMPMEGDAEQFRQRIQNAKKAGADTARVACLSGRRYETFKKTADWRAFVKKSETAMELAARVAEQERFTIAMENHKDWTLDDLYALMDRYGGEYFGLCLDTGNNIALLDDPDELVFALAKWAVSTHLKDMAWTISEDGILLSEVPFGEGFLPVSAYVKAIAKARPKTRWLLEMITRDPLKVPCGQTSYQALIPPSRATAKLLAQAHRKNAKLPITSVLSAKEQWQLEEDNVKICLERFPKVLTG
jgi:3-oxoisoapionate decarboxylase